MADVTTPTIADACIRCDVPLRAAPAGVRPVVPGMRVSGRALPTRHVGSVDVFLEALGHAEPGDEYLAQRGADPGYTFRAHLRRIGGAVEE